MVKIVLVSIVHNRKHLVGPALQSAVNQTLDKSKWLHLVLDNASTDGADKVCEVFAKKHSHIYFERMGSNLGQMPAYNFALKWINKNFPEAIIMSQLDSDDLLYPHALEKVYDMFEKNANISMAYSNFDIIGPSPKDKLKCKQHPKAKEAPDQFSESGQKNLRKMQIAGNVVGHLRSISIKKLNEIGGFDESYKYSTDYNMACRMLDVGTVVKISGPSLYKWREHGEQVQGYASPEQTKNYYEIKNHYLKKWKNEGKI